MKSLPEIVKSVRLKTEKMLALQETLQRDNIALTQLVKQLKGRIEELENANRQLEDQNKTLRLAKSISGEKNDENKLALKLRINELVREIDKCIAQLNR
jgi:hypothetical protein